MPPLVSIITPAFNAERYLAATIDSVLAQTFVDWELLISDDASTDGTLALAQVYAARDPRIRVLANPPTRHPGPVRNAAVAEAKGRYLAMLDADDLWLPEKLECQLAAIRGVDKPGICYAWAEAFSDRPGPPPPQHHLHSLPDRREEQYAETLLTSSRACTSSWMISREFADEIGRFTAVPLLAGYEDWDFILRALWRRPCLLVPRILVRYRVHEASITREREGAWERNFEIYRQAELRGELPVELRPSCLSAAWVVRAESELRLGKSDWRGSFFKAFTLTPLNWRRWPGLLAPILPLGAMRWLYGTLLRIQANAIGRQGPSHSGLQEIPDWLKKG